MDKTVDNLWIKLGGYFGVYTMIYHKSILFAGVNPRGPPPRVHPVLRYLRLHFVESYNFTVLVRGE